MTRLNKKKNVTNEITLDLSSIRERERQRVELLSVISIASVFGICMGFYKGFQIPAPVAVFAAVSVVVSVATQFSLQSKKRMKIGIPLLLSVILFYSILCGGRLVNGMTGIMNGVITFINESMAQANVKFVVSTKTLGTDMVLASVTICAITALIFCIALRYKRMFLCTVLLLGSSMLNIMYKGIGNTVWIIYSLICIFIVYYFSNIRLAKQKGSVSSGTIVVLVFLAASVCFAMFIQYRKITSVDDLKEELLYHGGNIVYGKSDYPEGQLKRYDQIRTDEKTRLKVTMDGIDELHLKGYVGCKYTERGWTKNDENIYGGDYTGMIDWFRANNFYPLTQISMYLQFSLDNGLEEDKVEGASVHVENLSASRKYEYVSENLAFYSLPDMISPKQDVNFVEQDLFGEKEYWYDLYKIEEDDYLAFPEQDWFRTEKDGKEFIQAENVYRSFANQFYMEVPEEELQILKEHAPECNNNVLNAVPVIRRYLKNEIEYSEEVEPYNPDVNYIEQVLLSDCRGYSPHFATIATLLFRYYGIPARYVEGYYVINDEQEDMVEVTAEDAHAWVEVYVKGLGFVPVEVTPGYYVEEENGGSSSNRSDTDSSGGGGTTGSSKDQEINVFDINYKLILMCLLYIAVILVVLTLFVMIIRRIVICSRRKKHLQSSNLYEVIAEAGVYMDALYHFDGKQLEQEIPADVRRIFEKTKFSSHLLKKEEMEKVLSCMEKVLEDTWKAQKLPSKMNMMFVKCLK